MRQVSILSVLFVFLLPVGGWGQSAQEASVPRLITISGMFRPADGRPAASVETVTLSIYADQQGGTPLWQETQNIAIDAQGRYSLLLGATHPDGIPAAVFNSEAAHWLGTVFERAGEVEGPRMRLTSVPYALRAAEADTLGGRPASAYLLAPTESGAAGAQAAAGELGAGTADVVLPGAPNFLAKYVNGADVGSSGVFEAADGAIGLGTTTPFDRLHIRYDNNTGDFTGLAVQNTNPGAFAYSGMLFYDHANALTQFQGYNNATHEYRINNIARVSPGGAFNGSINFMLGGSSRFFASPFGAGIGTTTPTGTLEVSNALIPTGSATTTLSSYVNAFGGSALIGQRARGTAAAPTALQNGDGLLELSTRGFGATGYATGRALISMSTTENWTDTAQGAQISFSTTSNGTATPGTRMVIGPSGNVGIGTFSALSGLEVSNSLNTQPFSQVTASTFAASGQGSLFVGRKARGTSGAPAAVQNGDVLAGFLGRGYGATNFNGTGNGGMFVRAAENWTDTAQGTSIGFSTSSLGTAVPLTRMTLSPSGNLGIGTGAPTQALEVARNGNSIAAIRAFGTDVAGGFLAQIARGTQAAPTAAQAGDALGYFAASSWDGTSFDGEGSGMVAYAAENWTPTTRGAGLVFYTTPIGLPEGPDDGPFPMFILPSGNVGIGVPADVNGLPPAIGDKLQVNGDIRIGTFGTNGCIRRFDGTGIAGTCASDRRFKKDITPFGHVLDRLTALQPVHYFWRASEFPDQHFGDRRAYGLIAQDVERVLPELVVTNDDGFKAVDYSELPLLTIQAVKDLKTENDALKQRVAALEKSDPQALLQRIAELERLVTKLVADALHR